MADISTPPKSGTGPRLIKKPEDIPVLDGLCAVLLSKGDAKGAEEAINKLAKIDPTNQDLPQFKDKLTELKSAKK